MSASAPAAMIRPRISSTLACTSESGAANTATPRIRWRGTSGCAASAIRPSAPDSVQATGLPVSTASRAMSDTSTSGGSFGLDVATRSVCTGSVPLTRSSVTSALERWPDVLALFSKNSWSSEVMSFVRVVADSRLTSPARRSSFWSTSWSSRPGAT
jgi:hypothetical protein